MGIKNSVPEILSVQELNPEGHTTRIIETLQFFGSRLPSVFEKCFIFQCQENSTTWSIQVTFYRLPIQGTVTCEIAIRRLDDAPVDMGTDFWMRPILSFPFPDLCTRNLRAEGLLPNHRARTIIEFIPNEAMVQLGKLPLRLEVFFRIRKCHGDSESAGQNGAVHQERFPPPTASEEMLVEELSQKE